MNSFSSDGGIGRGIKPKYIIVVILSGSFFLGSGVLMILLACSLPSGSLHALWTVFLNTLALMWPLLCKGCDFSESRLDNSFLMDSGYADVNDMAAARTRLWVFIVISLMMVCQGSTVWIAVANYDKAPDAWPSVALILNCLLQSISGILFFAAR